MDLHALLRRLRNGESDRAIARALPLSRTSVGKYRLWATQQHLLTGELPDLATLHQLLDTTFKTSQPRQNQSSLRAYRAEVAAMLARGFTPRLIYQILSERPDFTGSESAVYRLCVSLRQAQASNVVVRVETRPGEVAQVDFGEVGQLFDPQTQRSRRTYVFVMVLAWSRHMYAELVFDQKLPTWLLCHQHAFEFFKGVPQRVVLDNLHPL